VAEGGACAGAEAARGVRAGMPCEGGGRKGRGRREKEGKGKTHLRGSKFRRPQLQTLGHHGEREREVEEGEGGYCVGEIK
jgi:hypothetical protein